MLISCDSHIFCAGELLLIKLNNLLSHLRVYPLVSAIDSVQVKQHFLYFNNL